MTSFADATLDAILTLQLTVAWAGEGRCDPPRLGWWDTDLVSEDGGGDFLARLLPRTHAWAALETVREAARRTDAAARAAMEHPERVRSLYFLGFELDEQLTARLAAHKRTGRAPAEVLPLPVPFDDELSLAALTAALAVASVSFDAVAGGRQLNGDPPAAPEELVRHLAAALLPFSERYPLPFYPWAP